MTRDLAHRFETEFGGLAMPPNGSYVAVPIEAALEHRLAMASDGTPALLLKSRDEHLAGYAAPVILENLSVRYDAECLIYTSSGDHQRSRFTVIQCTSWDKHLRKYFLTVVSVLLRTLGAHPPRKEIAESVASLVELFRVLGLPPKQSIQGLWGELFLIANAERPHFVARAWHPDASDRFDFVHGDERIEVKTAVGRIRGHHFSFDQLRPPAELNVVVLSLFVESVGGGMSLGEVLEQVRGRLSDYPSLTLRVDTLVAHALGNSLRHALEKRFDAELAKRSLAAYAAASIPSIESPLPIGVSEVRFKSDLTNSRPIQSVSDEGNPLLTALLSAADMRP